MRRSTWPTLTACLALLATPIANSADLSSGFIDNPPALTADAERAGAKIWKAAGFDLAKYDKVAFDQIEIFIDPRSKYKGLSPDELKAIADQLQRAMAAELEPDYPLVGKTGPGVLYMRIAVANVNVKKKKRGLLSFTPMGMAVTTIQEIAGSRTSLQNAVVEAEVLDGASGERIAVFVDDLAASVGSQQYSWAAVAAAAEYYGKRLRARMDAAHGK